MNKGEYKVSETSRLQALLVEYTAIVRKSLSLRQIRTREKLS